MKAFGRKKRSRSHSTQGNGLAQLGEYINEHASAEQFDILENLISRLENIMTENLYSIFTSKDSFIWFTLFHKFTQLSCDDGKFADFLTYFKKVTEEKDPDEFYGVDKNSSTKDKNTVLKKLDKLETMMCEFLGIVKVKMDEGKATAILEFVREQVASYVIQEDVEQYVEVLESLARNIGQSKLREDDNMPSLIAVVAWSFEHDTDLDDWIMNYCSRNDTYINDQVDNFRHMCDDLEQFIQQTAVA